MHWLCRVNSPHGIHYFNFFANAKQIALLVFYYRNTNTKTKCSQTNCQQKICRLSQTVRVVFLLFIEHTTLAKIVGFVVDVVNFTSNYYLHWSDAVILVVYLYYIHPRNYSSYRNGNSATFFSRMFVTQKNKELFYLT